MSGEVLTFTVHGASRQDIRDEVDKRVAHFLGDSARTWITTDASITSRVAASTQDGEPVLYSAEVVVRFAPTPFRQEYPPRMHVTLLDDYGEVLLTAIAVAGEHAEFQVLPRKTTTVTRLVIS